MTATAEVTENYNESPPVTTTVTVQLAPLVLNIRDIAGDDTVNIAEKAAGFMISGDTGSEGGVEVSVTIGSQSSPLTTTSDGGGAWSVRVPTEASYLTETITATDVLDGHLVRVSAKKTGFTANNRSRRLAVDLTAPSVTVSTDFPVPASLRVGQEFFFDLNVTSPRRDIINTYRVTGLPSGVEFEEEIPSILGTLDTANPSSTTVTVTVTDPAGNPTELQLNLPPVDKRDQSLGGLRLQPRHGEARRNPPRPSAPPPKPWAPCRTRRPPPRCAPSRT